MADDEARAGRAAPGRIHDHIRGHFLDEAGALDAHAANAITLRKQALHAGAFDQAHARKCGQSPPHVAFKHWTARKQA